MAQCQAAVAEAVETFGKLDILLCCSSEGWHYTNRWGGRMKADWHDSTGRHGRRARRISTGTNPSTGTVREQLLRSGQLHQGCTTDDAEKE